MKTILLICSLFYTGLQGTSQSTSEAWPRVSSVTISTSAQKNTIIKWTADSEGKDLIYEVERSTNGLNFKTVAIVLTGFKADEGFQYLFKEKYQGNKIIYRIKQKKQDGTYQIAAERTL
jgi:hypothetical protein